MSESAIPGQNTQDFIDENMMLNQRMQEMGNLRKAELTQGQGGGLATRANEMTQLNSQMSNIDESLSLLKRMQENVPKAGTKDVRDNISNLIKSKETERDMLLKRAKTIREKYSMNIEDLEKLAQKRINNPLQRLIKGGVGHGLISAFGN